MQKETQKKKKYSIGIDLGTTYSCVAVYKNNRVDIIPNRMGARTTPSVISFSKNECKIGIQAKSQITSNYKNTVYDTKRLIGRYYNDESVQNDMKLWPFLIEKDENDKPLIMIEYENEKKSYYPEDISAKILTQLKEDAQTFLGENSIIDGAVITVPAYFNNLQRQATIDAGKKAGLNVIKIINEPTAAAIAYGLENKSNKKKNVCVFDLGGGTFDVTILEIDNKKFNVKTTGGDSHLGGQDFDNELIKFCIEKFKEENGIDITLNKKAERRLKFHCEKLKIDLSAQEQNIVDLENLADGEDLILYVSQTEFNQICKKHFDKCIQILNQTIKNSGLKINEINDVVLIGGSTRIPEIQKRIKKFFDKNTNICKTINVDEAVAYGAAIEAALHNEEQRKMLMSNYNDFQINDINPHSIGISNNGKMYFIIKKDENIPFTIEKKIRTSRDNQTFFGIAIYEGENDEVSKNVRLGYCILDNIKMKEKGKVSGKIKFILDTRYILKIIIEEEGRNNKRELEIERKKYDEKEFNKGMVEIIDTGGKSPNKKK